MLTSAILIFDPFFSTEELIVSVWWAVPRAERVSFLPDGRIDLLEGALCEGLRHHFILFIIRKGLGRGGEAWWLEVLSLRQPRLVDQLSRWLDEIVISQIHRCVSESLLLEFHEVDHIYALDIISYQVLFLVRPKLVRIMTFLLHKLLSSVTLVHFV